MFKHLVFFFFQLVTPWMTWSLSGRRMDQFKWPKASRSHSSSWKMNQTSDTALSTTIQVTQTHTHAQTHTYIRLHCLKHHDTSNMYTGWNGCHMSSIMFSAAGNKSRKTTASRGSHKQTDKQPKMWSPAPVCDISSSFLKGWFLSTGIKWMSSSILLVNWGRKTKVRLWGEAWAKHIRGKCRVQVNLANRAS